MKMFNILVYMIMMTTSICCQSIEKRLAYQILEIEKKASYEIHDSALVFWT